MILACIGVLGIQNICHFTQVQGYWGENQIYFISIGENISIFYCAAHSMKYLRYSPRKSKYPLSNPFQLQNSIPMYTATEMYKMLSHHPRLQQKVRKNIFLKQYIVQLVVVSCLKVLF